MSSRRSTVESAIVACLACLCIVVGVIGAVIVGSIATQPPDSCFESPATLEANASLSSVASLATSCHGQWLVVGAQSNTNSVALFVRRANDSSVAPSYMANATLLPVNAVDGFGQGVAISRDSRWIAIGQANPPAVVIFERNASNVYVVHQQIDGDDASFLYGSAVALSSDGQTLIVGDPGFGGTDYYGFIDYFFRDETSREYTRIQRLDGVTIVNDASNAFGSSLALTSNASWLVVGAPRSNSGDGQVALLQRTDALYSLEGLITRQQAQTSEGGFLGSAVAVDDAFTTVAIGAERHSTSSDLTGEEVGAVIIARPTQITQTIFGQAQKAKFGASVSLAATGADTLVVGSWSGNLVAGAASVYRLDESTRDYVATEQRFGATNDVGRAVIVSDDATVASSSRTTIAASPVVAVSECLRAVAARSTCAQTASSVVAPTSRSRLALHAQPRKGRRKTSI